MIPTSLRHLRSIGRRDTSRVVPFTSYSPNVDMGDLCDAVEWDWPRWGRRILVTRNRPRDWMRHDGLSLAAFLPPGYHIECGWKPRNGEYVEPGEIVPVYPSLADRGWPPLHG